jgi:ABC-type transporter Mla maintaining outer membrane lipid asymmetry permease subunit MlaE
MMTTACVIFAAAAIGAVAYAFHKNIKLETFGNNENKGNNGNKLMFRGSGPSAPVVCLAGAKHVPCTAFSSA